MRKMSLDKIAEDLQTHDRYDFTKPEDAGRFAQNYPAHAALPVQYLDLVSAAGLEACAPVIYLSKKYESPSVGELSFSRRRSALAIVMGKQFLERADVDAVLHSMGHELGHAALGHTKVSSALPGLLSLTFTMQASVSLALAGSVSGGLAYLLSGAALNFIATAKSSQYNEREADRFALVKTGITEPAAQFFDLDHNITALTGKKTMKTILAMLGTHPPSRQRANYIRDFEKNNPVFCTRRRQALGVQP